MKPTRAERWDLAKDAEMTKWENKGGRMWSLIPPGVKVIPTTWVLTYKEDDIKGVEYKARCVVQGFRQIKDEHYNRFKVLSPVAELSSIRLLTVIATEYDYPIHHLDIEAAYLSATLPEDEQIYVRPPEGYNTREGYCWRLIKSVYGMKQSSYEWFQYLKKKMENLGMKPSGFEKTIFTQETKKGRLLIGPHVEDLSLVAENEEVLEDSKNGLESIFDLEYFVAVTEYLGIESQRSEEGYILSQEQFLKKMLKNFENTGIIPKKNPIRVDHEGYGSSNNPKEDAFYITAIDESPLLMKHRKTKYESGVGSINWAANKTRPDLTFAANFLASEAS